MPETVLWHNARCSKSRETKELLIDLDPDLEVREYLKDSPTRAEIESLLDALGVEDPRQIIRTGEDAYKQLDLAEADREELIDAIVDSPILLQRPIAVRDGKAVVGRPPELVKQLF